MKTSFTLLLLSLFFSTTSAVAQSKNSDYLAALNSFSANEIRSAVVMAKNHGLAPTDYWPESLELQFQREGNSLSVNEQAKAGLLRLLQNLHSGALNPELLGKDFYLSRKSFVSSSQLSTMALVQGGRAQGLVQAFEPQNPPYRGLQEALQRMNTLCSTGVWETLPSTKTALKLGSVNPALPAIKTRLRQLGYNLATIDDTYDSQTLAAVNDIQNNLHFKPDGIISPNGKTWNYLNTSCNQRIQQIRLDLEKLRWFPKDFGDRYIYVNLAMTYLNYVDKANGQNQVMKTISGRSARKSPTMIDKITYIVVNPFWVIPPTIFREDKVADLRRLRSAAEINAYFAKGNYEVWNKSFTRRINPSSIDWNTVTNSSDIYIRQLPGMHNALGVLKFMMTNDIAIYLHDTNQRELFKDYDRQISSGCVRVERPYDLAEQLLSETKWNRQMIDSQTAKPGQVLSKDTYVTLPRPMPVYMVFQSAHLASDGVLRFAEDTYNQNARMLQYTK